MHLFYDEPLAGEAAHRRFNPRSIRNHHYFGDRVQAMRCERECRELAGTDAGRWDTWKMKATVLVETNWQDVQRIAAALLEHGTLDHEGCRGLVVDLMPPPCPVTLGDVTGEGA